VPPIAPTLPPPLHAVYSEIPEKEWNFADVGIQLLRFYQARAAVRAPA